ncbi:dicarboxylate/amino acid:cation symporter [Gaopeijia maritima]|uniref:Dicarboxylate/amino acid:cation symporter n=1 Tax=Gaopeijia maritima TaxID=3119007 RepID=A0ABU9EB19_9BACT
MNNRLMLLGLAAGLLVGLAASTSGAPLLLGLAEASAPAGDLFIAAIQMVVIPLVMAIVFAGVARLGDTRTLGRMGGSALGFIVLTTAPAVVLGMVSMHVALGFVPPVPIPEGAPVAQATELPGLIDFLVGLVPRNPFAAAADGRLLPLLVFSVMVGAAAGTLGAESRERLVGFADAVSDAFIVLVRWILWTAPVGIFGLVAPATARMGLTLLQSLAVFIVTVIVALFVFMVLVYLPLVTVIGRVSPGRFIRGTIASYTMGFTTTSSVATLPVLLRDAPDLGVSQRVTDLVIPLAASLNRAGSGLFQGASVVFLAWLYGVQVPGGAWVGAAIACFFAAATVAPVPSASIMTMAPALSAVGAPFAGLGILLGVDRIPDMFRSATNMTGHMAAAVVTEALAGDGE